ATRPSSRPTITTISSSVHWLSKVSSFTICVGRGRSTRTSGAPTITNCAAPPRSRSSRRLRSTRQKRSAVAKTSSSTFSVRPGWICPARRAGCETLTTTQCSRRRADKKPTMSSSAASFRQPLIAREPLIGTFLKTPTGHATEIIGDAGFDFVVIDQEHAPFDRTTSDIAFLAARAAGLPALGRVPGPDAILSVLDCGGAGVLIPHVSSPDYARTVAALCRY